MTVDLEPTTSIVVWVEGSESDAVHRLEVRHGPDARRRVGMVAETVIQLPQSLRVPKLTAPGPEVLQNRPDLRGLMPADGLRQPLLGTVADHLVPDRWRVDVVEPDRARFERSAGEGWDLMWVSRPSSSAFRP